MILEVLFALYEIEHFPDPEITLMRVALFAFIYPYSSDGMAQLMTDHDQSPEPFAVQPASL